MNREQTSDNPVLCACGCGRPTLLSDRNRPQMGIRKGEPLQFLHGHNGNPPHNGSSGARLDLPEPNPSGLCMCGCGEPTELAPYSSTRWGWVIGKPMKFINHHWGKTQEPEPWNESMYELRDMGYHTLCWHWLRAKSSLGYGKYSLMGAHVYSYILHKGPVPEGFDIDHLCRNPSCVNPDHLEAVPHRENMRRGKNTKISQSNVELLRTMSGSNKQLASIFGLDPSYISRLRRGISRPF